MKEEKTPVLIIKHFPAELSLEDREDFLKHFGAVAVRCMPDSGRLKYTCFATFSSQQAADNALPRLHQLEILGCRLSAEYAKEVDLKHSPHVSDNYPKVKVEHEPEKKFVSEKEEIRLRLEEVSKKIHGVAPTLGLNYLPSQLLKYKYPHPTPSIIANISHCLASVPKFYVQVLHLMNKMNLPAPFGSLTPAPPLYPDLPLQCLEAIPEQHESQEQHQEEEMDVTETESELESEDGDTEKVPKPKIVKRRSTNTRKQSKKRRLELLLRPPVIPTEIPPTARTDTSEVFEGTPSDVQAAKKIQINIKGSSDPDKSQISLGMEDNVKQEVLVQEGGFGVIVASHEKHSKNNEGRENTDEEWWENVTFIPLSEIRKNKISHKEMQELSVFRNYEAGEPASRLYIKNLAKQATEKDLYSIYGRYIDLASEIERNMFDVRLMKEGRMKGQAFITLADESEALRAVNDTNGYMLHGKPVVVQFARSAKPKEKPEKISEKK